MKKLISSILSIVMTLSLVTPCFAADANNSAIDEDLLALVDTLYPGSEVRIDEQGTLHIFVDASVKDVMTRAGQIYAPEGGRFHHFVRPPLTDPHTYAPLSIVFLPHEEVDALSIALENEDLFNEVVDLLKTLGAGVPAVKKIIDTIKGKYGAVLTPAGVLLLGTYGFYSAIDWIDRYQFNQARAKYDKLCIQQLTLQGNMANVYIGWSGNYVSASPYDNWNPTFTAGDYTFY